jgi:hypothetical protein
VHRERRLIQVPLTPKVFDTLLVLLENSSHVLTKKELMQQLWPDSLSKRTTSLRTSRYCGRRSANAHITKEIEWFRGREIDFMEHHLLAIFDGPARAIRCASTIAEYCSRLGVRTCTGLHTGECEIVDGQVSGAAAQMCVCVANEAEAGEVLVSSTVKDLVAGSGINFGGESRLFAVKRSA